MAFGHRKEARQQYKINKHKNIKNLSDENKNQSQQQQTIKPIGSTKKIKKHNKKKVTKQTSQQNDPTITLEEILEKHGENYKKQNFQKKYIFTYGPLVYQFKNMPKGLVSIFHKIENQQFAYQIQGNTNDEKLITLMITQENISPTHLLLTRNQYLGQTILELVKNNNEYQNSYNYLVKLAIKNIPGLMKFDDQCKESISTKITTIEEKVILNLIQNIPISLENCKKWSELALQEEYNQIQKYLKNQQKEVKDLLKEIFTDIENNVDEQEILQKIKDSKITKKDLLNQTDENGDSIIILAAEQKYHEIFNYLWNFAVEVMNNNQLNAEKFLSYQATNGNTLLIAALSFENYEDAGTILNYLHNNLNENLSKQQIQTILSKKDKENHTALDLLKANLEECQKQTNQNVQNQTSNHQEELQIEEEKPPQNDIQETQLQIINKLKEIIGMMINSNEIINDHHEEQIQPEIIGESNND